MNSVIILVFSIVWVSVAYYWYGKKRIQDKLMAPLDREATPANALRDGVDYSPAPRLVLFGHHFSSIAGAGPIVGPIIAVAAFGWGPAVLWLLIGGVFIGAVHDYLSLMISVKRKGASIPDAADEYVSRRARFLFLFFVWLALVLVIAVFAAFAARIMVTMPEIVLPTFLLIPLAVGFGILQKKNTLPLPVLTILAIVGLAGLIWLGFAVPVVYPHYGFWFVMLMLYAFAASVTPVWILLQPRDYISSWVLIIGVALALVGIFFTHPAMSAPVVTSFVHDKQGPMMPFLFIIIACGAVSGFHSIVASGTTSKQLTKEKDALPVAFGGMLAETVIGIISVIIAGGALAWTGNGGLHDLLSNSTPLSVYGAGFGKLTAFIFGSKLGALIGATIINIFIMTTLDTSVRLGRFLTVEIIGDSMPKARDNKFLVTLLPIVPAFWLGISGEWKAVWPVFGSANQLVAALVLIIVTAYLYSKGKPIVYTIWATVFMLITTITALFLLAKKYLTADQPNWVLGILSVVLIILALSMMLEGLKFLRSRSAAQPVAGSD